MQDGDEASTPLTTEVITFEDTSAPKRIRITDFNDPDEDNLLIKRLKPVGRQYVRDKESIPPPIKQVEDNTTENRVQADIDKGAIMRLRYAASVAEQRKTEERVRKYFSYYLTPDPQDAQSIISAARQKAEEERKREEERLTEEKAEKEKEVERKSRRAKEKAKQHKMTAEEKEALKEKRLQKLIGQVVVKCLSKHRDQLDHATFKKKAKEVCVLLFLINRKCLLT